jgi:hypothetical protein
MGAPDADRIGRVAVEAFMLAPPSLRLILHHRRPMAIQGVGHMGAERPALALPAIPSCPCYLQSGACSDAA